MEGNYRGCATCKRIIAVQHADSKGNCFYCAPESFDADGNLIEKKRRWKQDPEPEGE